MYIKHTTFAACLILFNLFIPSQGWAGFKTVSSNSWDQTAVRKVLHTFAYGGFASDEQIDIWSRMKPATAIKQIITFDPVNPYLSPPEDATSQHASTLESLQDFWSTVLNPENPVPANQQQQYAITEVNADNTLKLSTPQLQRTWVQTVTTRGINPLLHNVVFYLTNYHMAIAIHKAHTGLMRSFYDDTLVSLSTDTNLINILAAGASSAAVTRAYGSQYNIYDNKKGIFQGNDDFAREFHQLFFKILGEGEDPDYHENTTIEHTAWALTGMNLDMMPGAYGLTSGPDASFVVAPIVFADHQDGWIFSDGSPHNVYNFSRHYQGCLEILRNVVCGATAEEKINALAQLASSTDESLRNLPAAIISHFADDNLDANKNNVIESAWREMQSKSLLTFLRAYAISTLFHNVNTVKYRTSFSRNLTIANLNTLSNVESFAMAKSSYYLPISIQMKAEGAIPFEPAHDVFGGQTGLQSANNPNIFRDAYSRNVNNPPFLGTTSVEYQSYNGAPRVWTKDWAAVIPSVTGTYRVQTVAAWLWNRFIGDGGKNFDAVAQAQLHAILATGADFGYAVNPLNPDVAYNTDDMNQPELRELDDFHKQSQMALDSIDTVVRDSANRRIGLAVNFITATPYMFALEGK